MLLCYLEQVVLEMYMAGKETARRLHGSFLRTRLEVTSMTFAHPTGQKWATYLWPFCKGGWERQKSLSECCPCDICYIQRTVLGAGDPEVSKTNRVLPSQSFPDNKLIFETWPQAYVILYLSKTIWRFHLQKLWLLHQRVYAFITLIDGVKLPSKGLLVSTSTNRVQECFFSCRLDSTRCYQTLDFLPIW